MIYLDYSATTPVSYEVLESYNKATRDYIGNVNSIHSLGNESRKLYNSATSQIANIFQIMESEIIYTSGATEANNMALIGVAEQYKNRGNHIIVSKLEHPSIYNICDYLESIGFKISYVNNDEEGLIDFDDLRKKIKPETILVSINAVNSETGVRQPLKTIRQIVKKENQLTLLHSDMTQAVGKVVVNMHDVDLASFSAHKIYGPKGIGMLYKASNVQMKPILYGSSKTTSLRPGTPPLPLIVALSKAIRISVMDLDKKELYIKSLNDKIVDEFKTKYPNIIINKTKYSIPHILNVSVIGVKPESLVHALDKHEIYISTNTACSNNELSTSVMAMTNDTKRATSTIRISLSSLTSNEEINEFLKVFELEYNNLSKL